MILPANKLANLRRRVFRARDFPTNTRAPSRHLHMIAEGLLADGRETVELDDPEHCAMSMLFVLESLWKARTKLARKK